jgi:hypothetical protein
MRHSLLGFCCFFALALSNVALGEPSEARPAPEARPARGSAWRERPTSIEAHLGLGTPVGGLGVSADYSLVPEIALGAGAGIGSGFDVPSTLHTAALARLRPVYGVRNAFVANLAYSTGGYQEPRLDLGMGHSSATRRYGAERAHWFQLDLGWERRAESGFLLRISTGFARLLNPDDLRCVIRDEGTEMPCAVRSDEPTTIWTLDFALGAAL